jgi:hypothetical protein
VWGSNLPLFSAEKVLGSTLSLFSAGKSEVATYLCSQLKECEVYLISVLSWKSVRYHLISVLSERVWGSILSAFSAETVWSITLSLFSAKRVRGSTLSLFSAECEVVWNSTHSGAHTKGTGPLKQTLTLSAGTTSLSPSPAILLRKETRPTVHKNYSNGNKPSPETHASTEGVPSYITQKVKYVLLGLNQARFRRCWLSWRFIDIL